MKTIKTKLSLLMVSLALFLAAPVTNAFYMAEAGRWINRDPVHEYGFESLPRGRDAVILIGNDKSVSLFTFVGNQPVRNMDAFGLESTTTTSGSGVGLPPINIPPPSFPSGGAANAGNPGTLGGRNYGNFPDYCGSNPPRPCSPIGSSTPPKPTGKSVVKECPCSGTVTVQCFQWDTCDMWSFGTGSGPKGSLNTHVDCPCPEYSTF
jgi:hypothetical protein